MSTVDYKSLHFQYGPHKMHTGRAKGDSLSVVYNSESFTENVGVDGEGFWVANGDLSARITLTLLQNSRNNDILSRLHLSDRGAPGGFVLPLVLEEKNGTTVYSSPGARTVKMADGTWSDGSNVRVWTFSMIVLIPFLGGISPTPVNPNP